MTVGESGTRRFLAHSCAMADILAAQGAAGRLRVETSRICLMISVKSLEGQHGRARLGAVVSVGCERHRGRLPADRCTGLATAWIPLPRQMVFLGMVGS